MLHKTTSHLLFGNQYCGIEHTSIGGKETINATILKKTKKELNIDNIYQFNSIEHLSESIPKNTHAFLILNNENVLTKKVENGQKEAVKLVHQAFPNININDFMYEVLVQNDVHFVSICRRSYIKEVIKSYESKRIYILNLSLGNLIIANITDFIDEKIISTANAEIEISNNEISRIESSQTMDDTNYGLNGLEVNSKSILTLSAALVSALDNHKSITNFEPEKRQLTTAYGHTVFFRKFLAFALIFVFTALIMNFLAFNHYFNKSNTLEQSAQVNQNIKTQVAELNEKVSKSQKMVGDLLNNNNSKSSYFINEIVKNLPTSVQLKELNYQPLLKRIKAEEAIKNEVEVILVSGESTDSNIFSDWIALLEKKKWLSKVEVTDYADISTKRADFKFKILLSHD
ncbi:hypothetical protein [Gelidibacter japonicus]|uniref:hypothetical protein n=1 Tax=Gelidibacter japonicus TaxID=1962232 RepID=UPI002AFF3E0B|nr:hypothetical protein [Gelidibacter japonicus]